MLNERGAINTKLYFILFQHVMTLNEDSRKVEPWSGGVTPEIRIDPRTESVSLDTYLCIRYCRLSYATRFTRFTPESVCLLVMNWRGQFIDIDFANNIDIDY